MKILIRDLLILLLTLVNAAKSNGQTLKFEKLTQENILDRQPILNIGQDKHGRLWFGGEYNLYSYNGNNVFNLITKDSVLKKTRYISKFIINTHNHIFIVSDLPLFIYDIDRQKPVEIIGRPYKDKVFSIRTIHDRTFICSDSGLYEAIFREKSQSYEIRHLFKRSNTQDIVAIDKQKFLLASDSGLEILMVKNDTIFESSIITAPFSLKTSNVSSMLVNNGEIWIGTKKTGVYIYNLSTKIFKSFNEINSNLLSNNVRKIIRNPNGEIWIGTLKGLCVYLNNNHFRTYKHDKNDPYSLSQNSIYDIFVDRQQNIWIGTYFGGINSIYPNLIPITLFSTHATVQYQINSDVTSSFAESLNSYWIGTEEEGLIEIGKRNHKITHFSGLTKSNLIKDIFIRDSILYSAQYAGGFSITDLKSNTTKNYAVAVSPSDPANNVFSIYVDAKEKVYLGTNKGLYIYSSGQKPTRVSYIPAIPITDIQADHYGKIYILAESRIYRSYSEDKFALLQETKNLMINGFHIDSQDRVLLTSEDYLYSYQEEKMKQIVHIKDNYLGWPFRIGNKIWVTSKNGLLIYNIETRMLNTLNGHDGIPSNDLQNAKLFLARNGNLFLTTHNGLVEIQTNNIHLNKISPNAVLQDITVGDKSLPWDRLESQKNDYKLDLSHHENFLTIRFSSDNMIKPAKNQFMYRLKGFEKSFQRSSIPSIRYTNIPPGKYTLEIFASNNDGMWSKKPLSIYIHIHPPLWKTWWAYMLYALVILLLTFFIIKSIVERRMLINSKNEHEKKIHFFTRISHEIRTPLTLITVPMQEFIDELIDQPPLHLKAVKMQRNAQKLLNIVNELLDFRKLELGKMHLNLSAVSIREYIEDFFYLFSDLAATKKINYTIKRLEDCGWTMIDQHQFDKVLFNLLSNAIKYTPENGTVFLELYIENDSIVLKIADNGIGVSPENQFKIFEEYYRESKAEKSLGSGIGLALTREIVEKHDGKISCTNENIAGLLMTVFKVILKREKVQMAVDESLAIGGQIYADTIELRHDQIANQLQLLIVEDNAEMSEILLNILKEYYLVHICENGKQGYEQALKLVPDLIIADVMMPLMNGIEMCQALKSNMITSHIPIILLTADVTENTLLAGLENGANIYLTKPFNKKTLLLSVKNLTDISIKERKNFKLIGSTHQLNEKEQHFLEKTEQIIDDNLLNPEFSVLSLAQELGMSKPILYKKMKQLTDLSVNNFIKQYRFKKAISLMSTTDMNVNEIAYTIGFSDRKYFSNEFKKHFGISPVEFKSQI